jgi:RNase P/RNase MRP subunit POP5
MKNLTPAMQEDTRYLKFRVHAEENVKISELVNGFWDVAIDFLGSKNLSHATPWIIANKFDEEKQEGVIRVNKEYEEGLRAALTLVHEFEGKEGFLQVKKVSGSLSGVS